MGMGMNCYSLFYAEKAELTTEPKNPIVNINVSINNINNNKAEDSQEILNSVKVLGPVEAPVEEPLDTEKKKKKHDKNIKYIIEIIYSDKQIIDPDECFYVKNIQIIKSSKKIDYHPKKIVFEPFINRETENQIQEQLTQSKNIDKVLEDLSKNTNINLKSK